MAKVADLLARDLDPFASDVDAVVADACHQRLPAIYCRPYQGAFLELCSGCGPVWCGTALRATPTLLQRVADGLHVEPSLRGTLL